MLRRLTGRAFHIKSGRSHTEGSVTKWLFHLSMSIVIYGKAAWSKKIKINIKEAKGKTPMCWLSKITKISLSFMIFKNWDNSLWNSCNICIDSGLVQMYCPISRGYYKNYKLLESSKGKYAQWPKKLRLSSWTLPRATNWRRHSTKALSRLCEILNTTYFKIQTLFCRSWPRVLQMRFK